MIKAQFIKSNGFYTAFAIEGHAGFDECGKDIVCSAVTSAVMTALNGITECAKVKADAEIFDNEIIFNLKEKKQEAQLFLSALKLQLEYIESEFKGTINITVTEV